MLLHDLYFTAGKFLEPNRHCTLEMDLVFVIAVFMLAAVVTANNERQESAVLPFAFLQTCSAVLNFTFFAFSYEYSYIRNGTLIDTCSDTFHISCAAHILICCIHPRWPAA